MQENNKIDKLLKTNNMKIFISLFSMILLLIPLNLWAQDDLENILNNEVGEETSYSSATFKATRIMNGQSIERMPQGQLDFRIQHRFGTLNQKEYNFWGLDGATNHMSLEYGITDWVMLGIGREFGTLEKNADAFAKFSLWRQSTGKVEMPVTISWFTSITDRTADYPQYNSLYPNSTRYTFVNQALLARKFNNLFSLQLTPTHIHYNLVPTEMDPHDEFALGAGGRLKLTNRMSINAEYYHVFKTANMSIPYYDPLSIGIDIETGGHVFQLIFTNSSGMIEKEFIGRTIGKWSKGDIHFGFNISRVFDVNHHIKK